MNVERLIKRNKIAYKTALFIRQALGRAYMRLMHALFGVKRDKVLFSSFAGGSYSDSPRAISEALHEIAPELTIAWQFTKSARGADEAPDYIKKVRAHTLSALKEFSTARVMVDNFNRPFYMLKFKDQVLIQTWHGDRGFKKVMFDMDTGEYFPDHKYIDLAIAGSDYGCGTYRTAFRYTGEIMDTGMPRNDILIENSDKRKAEVRRRLDIPEGVKVLLYAPTFRNATASASQPALLDIGAILPYLSEKTGFNWLALVRGHSENTGITGANAVDVSYYPDMAELLLITDMLITDYSSSAGDFALTRRPLILYQPDRDRFMADDREFYFDMDLTPFWIARSTEDVKRFIDSIENAPGNCERILEFYREHENGRASYDVAEYIVRAMR